MNLGNLKATVQHNVKLRSQTLKIR